MKRFATSLLLMLLFASPASATQKVLIYSDEALTNTTLVDNTPRIVNFYVVEAGGAPNVGVRFSVKPGMGFTGVWLSDAVPAPFVKVGQSPTDVSVAYRSCLVTPLHILTVSYQLFGTSSPCSELKIAPADNQLVVISASDGCFFYELPILDLGSVRVNCPVATESTTWGQVKALYR